MISNIVTPIILATCVYNLISTIDMYMFYLVCGDGAKSISAFGAYGGEYIILQNVPVALASAMSTASIPNISSAWLFKDTAEVKKQIAQGTKVIMLILIPSAVGMSILAVPIIQAIFPIPSKNVRWHPLLSKHRDCFWPSPYLLGLPSFLKLSV